MICMKKSGEIPPYNKKLGMLKISKSCFTASSPSLMTDQHTDSQMTLPLPLEEACTSLLSAWS